MSRGDRIKQALEAQGRTVAELADYCGVTNKSVYKWLKGGRISPDRLPEVAAFLGLSVGDLLSSQPPVSDRNENIEAAPEVRQLVPLISWVAAGRWAKVSDPYPPGEAEEWIPSFAGVGPRGFALRVRGASMEPRFHEGEYIIVDPDACPDHGKFVVVRLNDHEEATFKQLVSEGGELYLRALNPQWPDPIIKVTEDADICGVVVGKFARV